MYVAWNRLDVDAAETSNAYFQSLSPKKDYTLCGPEFEIENIGKKVLIRRALNGGKAARRDFRNHFCEFMRQLKFLVMTCRYWLLDETSNGI